MIYINRTYNFKRVKKGRRYLFERVKDISVVEFFCSHIHNYDRIVINYSTISNSKRNPFVHVLAEIYTSIYTCSSKTRILRVKYNTEIVSTNMIFV
jgi:hypothetical protein